MKRLFALLIVTFAVFVFCFVNVRAQTAGGGTLIAASVTPYPSAPLCTSHDPTQFHTLWNSDLGCHYDHSHGMNPHDVDDIFGTQIYTWAGGEISYPWQTFAGGDAGYAPPPTDTLKLENVAKHDGYHWIVVRNFHCAANAVQCIRAFRIETHVMPHKQDAVVRYHSMWAEVQVCRGENWSVCGIVRIGGWQDFHRLGIDSQPLPTPLPGDDTHGVTRLHFWHGGLFASTSNRSATWYGDDLILGEAVILETLTAMEPDLTEHYFCDGYAAPDGNPGLCPAPYNQQNGSWVIQENVVLHLPDNLDGVVNGIVNISGYTNRHHHIVQGCTAVGLDCIPFEVSNILPNNDIQLDRTQQPVAKTEMDMAPAGEYWLHYPQH